MLVHNSHNRAILFVDPLMKEFAPKLFEELVNMIWEDFLVTSFEPEYDYDN